MVRALTILSLTLVFSSLVFINHHIIITTHMNHFLFLIIPPLSSLSSFAMSGSRVCEFCWFFASEEEREKTKIVDNENKMMIKHATTSFFTFVCHTLMLTRRAVINKVLKVPYSLINSHFHDIMLFFCVLAWADILYMNFKNE